MTDLTTVQDALQSRLASQRVVFWHDPAGEYAADLDTLDLDARPADPCLVPPWAAERFGEVYFCARAQTQPWGARSCSSAPARAPSSSGERPSGILP